MSCAQSRKVRGPAWPIRPGSVLLKAPPQGALAQGEYVRGVCGEELLGSPGLHGLQRAEHTDVARPWYGHARRIPPKSLHLVTIA